MCDSIALLVYVPLLDGCTCVDIFGQESISLLPRDWAWSMHVVSGSLVLSRNKERLHMHGTRNSSPTIWSGREPCTVSATVPTWRSKLALISLAVVRL